ncbi:Mth938-like domain-containing protein [Paracoccaceae bacterium Fryx2]|nr:Mth938-like domain-containing protein [Paracoccaceae bacterium Fryx2]
MHLTEITYDEARPIDSYGPGFFRIAGQVLRGPVLVTPWGAGAWGGFEDTAGPMALQGRIDVLFVGMGGEIAHAPQGFRATLEAAGIGVEVMNSPAACRTYNVLLSEGRRIAAALLPVEG